MGEKRGGALDRWEESADLLVTVGLSAGSSQHAVRDRFTLAVIVQGNVST